jgi:3',5'-cyclic AMP phosphodiesterase CpdA
MFRLGHISDVHLGGVPSLRARDFVSKRVIGYANWRRGRAHALSAASLASLVADLKAEAPDHIAVTGDLTNIARREEFERARRWLMDRGPPENVTTIPGNHDAYVPGAHRRFRRLWAPWMLSDDAEFVDGALFPFMRRKGFVALIGVSSAVASAPFMATGRVGREQTERLGVLLDEARREGLFRVVLIHHPPKLVHPRHQWRKLTDGRRFRRTIERFGAELILHGHDHMRMMTAVRGARGVVPVIGVPAGSAPPAAGIRSGGYAIHEIAEHGDAYALTVIHRGFTEDGTIGETARVEYSINRA